MSDTELTTWLRENSSGSYRQAAEAADRIEELTAAIATHKANFPDEPLEGEKKLWKVLERNS